MFLLFFSSQILGQIKLAKVKYSGGGDWYANKTSLPNLINYCNSNLPLKLSTTPETVELTSKQLFNYPFIHLTGHGNILFNDTETQNLRTYLLGGGFLHIDDNYGLDVYIRREMKKVFPSLEFVELPFTHAIYHQTYNFSAGLPKIHEHDGKSAQAFGLLFEGRLVCLYTFECDLGNGWEDFGIHGDSEDKRQQALKMGANILQYIFSQ